MNALTFKSILPLSVLFIIFLLLKHDAFNIRISDTNIYFYTARELVQGKFLYKEIFFTNLPLFPYISVLYGTLVGWRLEYFFAIPIIEIFIISFLIFRISLHHLKKSLIAYIPVTIYLFSFLILATSDHETGVYAANIFSLLGYYFYLKKKYIFSGIFLALMILTKVYFLPIFLAFVMYIFFKNKNSLLKIALSFIATFTLIIIPIYILSDGQMIKNLLAYSSQRQQGVSKISLLQFFALKDFILVGLLTLNFTRIREKNFFALLSIFSLLFILLYKDVYYLYLNFFAPFVAISTVLWLPKILKSKELSISFFAIIFISVLLSTSSYLSSYKDLQKIKTVGGIVAKIQENNPDYLYGINSITPALSYLTGIPLLDQIVDTNENRFLTGNLNANTLTKKALESNTLFITKSAVYPEFQINDLFMSAIFDKSLLTKCNQLHSEPIDFEGLENKLTVVKCQKL